MNVKFLEKKDPNIFECIFPSKSSGNGTEIDDYSWLRKEAELENC